jgi:hypothetical protein
MEGLLVVVGGLTVDGAGRFVTGVTPTRVIGDKVVVAISLTPVT